MPFELRPEPNETLRPEGEYLQKAWAQSVYPMAERLGVSIKLPAVSPQPHTRLAFEGYQYAKERGKAGEYNERVFRAFFQEGQDIGKVEVLAKLAEELGLDAEELGEALRSGKYRERHRQALRRAYREQGVTAVPTFVIGDWVLEGVQPTEMLERTIAAAERAAKERG